MAWSGFPVTQTTDWSDVDLAKQLIEAINERVYATHPSLFTAYDIPAVGADAQYARPFIGTTTARMNWYSVQAVVEVLCTYFLDSHNNASGFDGRTSWPFPHYTLATWRAAAGINASGFTRRFPREINATSDAGTNGQRAYLIDTRSVYDHTGGTWVFSADQISSVDLLTAYGLPEVGDYIGPHLFNEVKAGLEKLVWTGCLLYTSDAADE